MQHWTQDTEKGGKLWVTRTSSKL